MKENFILFDLWKEKIKENIFSMEAYRESYYIYVKNKKGIKELHKIAEKDISCLYTDINKIGWWKKDTFAGMIFCDYNPLLPENYEKNINYNNCPYDDNDMILIDTGRKNGGFFGKDKRYRYKHKGL